MERKKQLNSRLFFHKVVLAMQHARDYDNALTNPGHCQFAHEMLSVAREMKSFENKFPTQLEVLEAHNKASAPAPRYAFFFLQAE